MISYVMMIYDVNNVTWYGIIWHDMLCYDVWYMIYGAL